MLPARRLDVATERVRDTTRRCTSPSAMAVASMPPPECTHHLIDRGPVAIEANQRRAAEEVEAALGERDAGRRSASGGCASISRATFSSSGTVNGSSSIGPRQDGDDRLDGRERHGRDRGGARPPSRSRRASVAVRAIFLRSCRERRGEPPPAARQDARRRPRWTIDAVDALHLLVADGERLGLVGARRAHRRRSAPAFMAASTAIFATSNDTSTSSRDAAGARRPGPNRGMVPGSRPDRLASGSGLEAGRVGRQRHDWCRRCGSPLVTGRRSAVLHLGRTLRR